MKLNLAKWWAYFGVAFFILLTLSLAVPQVAFVLSLAYFVGCGLALASLVKGLKIAVVSVKVYAGLHNEKKREILEQKTIA